MSLSLRMAAPVGVLGVLSLVVQSGLVDLPMAALALLAVALAAGTWLYGHRWTRRLHALPDALRDLAWGTAPGPMKEVDARDEIGDLTRALTGIGTDMCAIIESRAEMEKLALTDPLTGLPNRRGLFAFFARIERTQTDDDGRLGVMHVDLDHFKVINDTHGHDAGDHVLREATRRISSAIRDSDVLARLGGDEFVVIAPGVESERTLERIAERIIEQFAAPIYYKDIPCATGASIGIVLGGLRGKVLDPSRLLINSDVALCHAKEAGRGRHAVFNSTMARAVQRRRTEADEIREGLINEAFQPWFLPTLDTRNGALVSIDVLARWANPARGLLSPSVFLDSVEAHNMAEELASQVFERACTAAAGWRAQGLHLPRLHFGMSRAQLLAPAIVDKISWLLDDAGLAPHDLEIGISERHCIGRSVELVFANLKRFQTLGAPLVLDDFGTDNAALSNIIRLGAARVRTSCVTASPQVELLRSLLGIGERLDMPIIMKNVGDDDEVRRLQILGVHLMQGPAIAPDMDAATMTDWLRIRVDPRQIAAGS